MPNIRTVLLHMLCSEYTKRYQQILLQCPWKIFGSRSDINLNAEDRDRIGGALLAYFDLCAEQVFLRQQGIIPTEVWTNWETGMRRNFARPLIAQQWKMAQEEAGYADLKAFLEAGMA